MLSNEITVRAQSEWLLAGRIRMRSAVAVLSVLLLQLMAPVAFAGGCWVDEVSSRMTKDSNPSRKRVEQMEMLAREINKVLHSNQILATLPDGAEPVRLRTRAGVASSYPEKGTRALWMQFREHRKEMWTGNCGVLERSENIEPRASIVVHVDAPDQILGRRVLYDDQITIWTEPPLTGYAAGHPVYFGYLVVLTSNGLVPWMPVSMEEYLQFMEREFQRSAESANKAQDTVSRQDDAAMDKELLAVYEGMKKFDPIAAEKMLADTRAQMRSSLPAARRNAESGVRIAAERLAALRTFRASLQPDELRSQARGGWHEPMSQEERMRLPLLVKLNPAWSAGVSEKEDYRGPQVIGLIIQGKGPFEGAMQDVMKTLDYRALESLLAKVAR